MSKDSQLAEHAASQVDALLKKVFENLKDVTISDQSRIILFPNGVELIYVKVEGGLSEKTKISAEVRIAGGKGLAYAGVHLENSESGPAVTDTANPNAPIRRASG